MKYYHRNFADLLNKQLDIIPVVVVFFHNELHFSLQDIINICFDSFIIGITD